MEAYVEAVKIEISRSEARDRTVETIFFGGGTPTYLSANQLGSILDTVRHTFAVTDSAEITSEANPTTSDAAKFSAMRKHGFNRLSVGVQAFDDRILPLIGREHSADEADAAVRAAYAGGFENVNLDLMFGLPSQHLADWKASLERGLALGTQHISVYALTLEPGTPFHKMASEGVLELPTSDDQADQFAWAIDTIRDAGLEHYEISNFARPDCMAQHNLVYWRNEEYAGFGPGAVSYLEGRRWTNAKRIPDYVKRIAADESLAIDEERLGPRESLGETLMLGIRLLGGMPLGPLRLRFGSEAVQALNDTFGRLQRKGLITQVEEMIRLTQKGVMLADTVAAELLAEPPKRGEGLRAESNR